MIYKTKRPFISICKIKVKPKRIEFEHVFKDFSSTQLTRSVNQTLLLPGKTFLMHF